MRMISAILGIVVASAAMYYVIHETHVPIKLYIDPHGIILVVVSSIAVTMLSFSVVDLKRILQMIFHAFFAEERNLKSLAFRLVKYYEGTKNEYDMAQAKQIDPFVADCVVLINDGYTSDEMKDMLSKRIYTYQAKELRDINMIKSLVKYPPAFGMLGTVIGLIAMMANIASGTAESIGMSMAVALTATLYGLVLSNFIFKPISDNLTRRSEANFNLRSMIMECMAMARDKKSVLVIQDLANSFLEASEAVSIFDAGSKNAA